jgi:DNA topoisomerase VI subunit B
MTKKKAPERAAAKTNDRARVSRRPVKGTPRRTCRDEKVKTRDSTSSGKQAKSSPKLERTTFRTSREMDFFSEKELTTQTGHPRGEWAQVIAKELIDNALDASEESDMPPRIEIFADISGITVRDNGPGIPDNTLAGTLDFSCRASNREMYVAPDRGAQGNALKTLLGMPCVIDDECGRLIVEANGTRHEIVCRADPISQRAVVHDEKTKIPKRGGTTVRVEWGPRTDAGETLWPFGWDDWDNVDSYDAQQFRELVTGYPIFNPHAEITLDWFGERTTWEPTDTTWTKWKPCHPTNPHWYERRHLERLIGAYITYDRDRETDRTVAQFLAEFDGLTGSRKRSRVLDDCDFRRVNLSELATDDGFNGDMLDKLLSTMQRHTKPVTVRRLGIIGEQHIRDRLLGLGCVAESIRYKRVARVDDGVAFVLETAFGWLGDEAPDRRQIYAGANWSPGIRNPFRSFGKSGEGLEGYLRGLYAGANEPIIHVIHVAHPRVEFTDRGKTAIVVSE